jgi:hypothetical protein
MGNIRCHLRWLLEYDGNLSSEMLNGSAVKVFHHTQPTFETFFLQLPGLLLMTIEKYHDALCTLPIYHGQYYAIFGLEIIYKLWLEDYTPEQLKGEGGYDF